ncbi:MAG TPA: L-2-amino-thiazoline-4-carboxylic acid hydrolase [Candidatus Anoxymicrobiaceae bacterium]
MHWQNRNEPSWKQFSFNQPYERGVKRLREEVLDKTDFDPAVLWQWGTMQAMAVIQILKDCEKKFGEEGQRVVTEALRKVGLDVGRQILAGIEKPEGMSEAEAVSFFATVINRIAYASLEDPRIDSEDEVSFDILWCPHQDCYSAFDCRVQRNFVQGMLDAAAERGWLSDWQVRFTQTIPAGADTCRFVIWRASQDEKSEWKRYSEQLDAKALEISRRGGKSR